MPLGRRSSEASGHPGAVHPPAGFLAGFLHEWDCCRPHHGRPRGQLVLPRHRAAASRNTLADRARSRQGEPASRHDHPARSCSQPFPCTMSSHTKSHSSGPALIGNAANLPFTLIQSVAQQLYALGTRQCGRYPAPGSGVHWPLQTHTQATARCCADVSPLRRDLHRQRLRVQGCVCARSWLWPVRAT
jgi:hypothetical protein